MEAGPAKLAKSADEPEHEPFRRTEIADRNNNGREPLRCVHLLFFENWAEENIKRPEFSDRSSSGIHISINVV